MYAISLGITNLKMLIYVIFIIIFNLRFCVDVIIVITFIYYVIHCDIKCSISRADVRFLQYVYPRKEMMHVKLLTHQLEPNTT